VRPLQRQVVGRPKETVHPEMTVKQGGTAKAPSSLREGAFFVCVSRYRRTYLSVRSQSDIRTGDGSPAWMGDALNPIFLYQGCSPTAHPLWRCANV
jgi:hypothetical protein